ncbi:hypothetical protein JKP88DRAFT_291309 [Tribonema minus]|uniref:Uncharacterized protein n=1 Tax=Tribonema minus TaxID=303371 RepID=A0A836CPI9_9STRA|nr:hypothetical protein JKP88DRAFT_291309 [Tribonema minus]
MKHTSPGASSSSTTASTRHEYMPQRKASRQQRCADLGGAVGLSSQEDAFAVVLGFLGTPEAMRLAATCRHLCRVVPAAVSSICVCNLTTFRGAPAWRRLVNVRTLTASAGRTSAAAAAHNDTGHNAALGQLLLSLPSLEEVHITNDSIDGTLWALHEALVTDQVKVLSLSTASGAPSSLCSYEQRRAWAGQLLALFSSRPWTSLTSLQLQGDWFDQLCLQDLIHLLAVTGVLRNLETLTLCLPPQTAAGLGEAGTMEGVDLAGALGAALSTSGNGARLRQLSVANLCLATDSAAQLFAALNKLHTPLLTDLALENCPLGAAAASALAAVIARTPRMRRIEACLGGLGAGASDTCSLLDLAAALRAGPHLASLETLALTNGHSAAPEATLALAAALAAAPLPRLARLTIASTLLAADAAHQVSLIVAHAPALRQLDLPHCALGDRAALYVAAAAWHRCPRLARLRVGGNRITELGAMGVVGLLRRCRQRLVVDFTSGAAAPLGGSGGGGGGAALFPSPPCVRSIVELVRSGNNPNFFVLLSRAAVAGATGSIVMSSTGQVALEYCIPRKLAAANRLVSPGLADAVPCVAAPLAGIGGGTSGCSGGGGAFPSLSEQQVQCGSRCADVASLSVGRSACVQQQRQQRCSPATVPEVGNGVVSMTWYL